jgi:hypothetical protein
MSDPADRRAVPEKPFSDAGFFFPVWPFAAGAKEQRRSEGIKGRRQKVFDAPGKKFLAACISPLSA